MPLIERYILRRILSVAVSALVVTTIIALTTQVLNRVDVLTASGQSLMAVFTLAVLLVPAMAVIMIAFALVIGMVQTFRTMNQDSELAVLEATGSSMKTRLRPVAIATIGASALTFLLAVFVEPTTDRMIRTLLADAAGDLLSTAVQSGSFTRVDDNLYIQIGGRDANGDFENVYISDRREAGIDLAYLARSGRIASADDRTFLIVEDGEIQRKDLARNTLSVIRFQAYTLDVANLKSAAQSGAISPKSQPTAYLFDPDPDDFYVKNAPHVITEELHRRLSSFLYPIAMALFVLYMTGAAVSNRQETGINVAVALFGAFATRGIGFFLTGISAGGPVQALLCYLYPILVSVVLLVLILRDRTSAQFSA